MIVNRLFAVPMLYYHRHVGAALAMLCATGFASAQSTIADSSARKPYVAIGLFFGSIEEGARIFTPVRLLPPAHPEALGHDFPTVQQFHGPEFPVLLWLGARAGLRLWPTLERYPAEPASDWPYHDFRPPPDTVALRLVRTEQRPRAAAPIRGLRAALFDGRQLVAFIVDTRGMTLADRHMTRATAMGLEISRAQLLRAMNGVVDRDQGLVAFVWSQP